MQFFCIVRSRLIHIFKTQNSFSVICLINLQFNAFCLFKRKSIQVIAYNSNTRIENI